MKQTKILEILKKHQNQAKKERPKKLKIGKILPAIQEYLDNSEEKQKTFLKVILNTFDQEENKSIRDKGIVVYIRFLKTLKTLQELCVSEGIKCKAITGNTTVNSRRNIEKWFTEDPANKIVFISDAGGASLNLNVTNEIILYTIPSSCKRFKQVIGRIARQFGHYLKFNIRRIMVKGALDEYNAELLGSKASIENDLLNTNTIPILNESSYEKDVFKRVRGEILWRTKKRKSKT